MESEKVRNAREEVLDAKGWYETALYCCERSEVVETPFHRTVAYTKRIFDVARLQLDAALAEDAASAKDAEKGASEWWKISHDLQLKHRGATALFKACDRGIIEATEARDRARKHMDAAAIRLGKHLGVSRIREDFIYRQNFRKDFTP